MHKKLLKEGEIQAVFFDLDGTIIASSGDLVAALNDLLEKHNKPHLSLQTLHKIEDNISGGVAAMLKIAFSMTPDQADFSKLKDQYFNIYKQRIKEQCTSCLYPSIAMLLDKLDEKNISWGVVTNKLRGLSKILLEHTKIADRCAVLIAAEDVSELKPSPRPLLKACTAIRCQPEYCVYVGDHKRDIMAGKRANMTTISAMYGYVEKNENILSWDATYNAKHPEDILLWLEKNQWKQPYKSCNKM